MLCFRCDFKNTSQPNAIFQDIYFLLLYCIAYNTAYIVLHLSDIYRQGSAIYDKLD